MIKTLSSEHLSLVDVLSCTEMDLDTSNIFLAFSKDVSKKTFKKRVDFDVGPILSESLYMTEYT